MAYDQESNRAIIFGSLTGDWYDKNTFSDETWTYDYNTNSWNQLELDSVPGRLWAQAMAYSPAIDRIILFSGHINMSHTTMIGDTWLFDLNTNTWTNAGLQP